MTDSIKTANVRKPKINQSDLDEFGYYATCPQCTYVQRHGKPRAGATHTAECRNRTIEALKLTDVGRARAWSYRKRVSSRPRRSSRQPRRSASAQSDSAVALLPAMSDM